MKWMHRISALTLAVLLGACGGAKPAGEPGHEDESQAEAGGHEEEGHEEAMDRTTIAAKVAQDAGIRVAPAAAGVIADEHEVQGLLTPVEGRVAKVMARFPGPIRTLRANVGDRVRAGQPLATIESNLSLTTYTVPAPISGVVLARNASIGTVAGEGAALYEIADLSELWVDLHIFGADAQHITAGVPVLVTRMSDGVTAETTLERVLPGTATASQSTVARATIRNLDGLWRPGSAVKARVTVDHQPVNLVVPLGALQTAGEDDVVYVRRGDTYVTRPVRGGRRDAQRVEIVSGLKAGEQVVVEQSFLVKADIEKSTAEHEH
ncbi:MULTISPECIES: efflux RND transporter periplasmic adaptor subunit [Lysobacteraceae]|jgi:RND family efflux transporter, MFP subunit|uniref:Efflux RND transporter periplasmic adaptor subunit n=2 Tax=Lysobacteraceae TaxID=32033 RepID=A0A5C5UDF0_9GAMM|nr:MULTISPECIES: efflux RND transporter periplasmic adaptor subunit [Xanthomonadaceae]KAF1705170.1 efflux RND transporter periplasmic adaptor subunit [Pseudoxanthomonas kaohsiungensis]MBP8922117.1 efflux RND transporter periplasmic adaptor subunit [Thauera sp.]PBJ81869.1 efflux RND transporter periplasmic adaptor subunit [Xanthomonadaceae bacterium NML93-0399]TWT23632.1 efflux RND transporter periplasmic adaptor subunit [Luteimonas marina]